MSERKKQLIVFCADLDNTLIYSYRHDIGEEKACVEVYEGREASFMTKRSSSLLKELQKHVMLVPTTTRTEEQYRRIDLKTGPCPYALVCNGGVLLKDGREIPDWYEKSLRLTEKSRRELMRARACMEADPDRDFEVRSIRELFLFTKSSAPALTMERIRGCTNKTCVRVFSNKNKVYVLPAGLDKGTALRRFRDYIKADFIYAAGDSAFDLPMLEAADVSYGPAGLLRAHAAGAHVTGIPEDQVFSDAVLAKILTELSARGIQGSC